MTWRRTRKQNPRPAPATVLRRIGVGLWLLVVVWASLAAPAAIPTGPVWLRLPHMDKLAHAGLYGMLALLGLWSGEGRRRRPWPAILRWAAFCTLLGVLMELLQTATAQRSADAWDVVANGVGGLLGGLCWRMASGRTL